MKLTKKGTGKVALLLFSVAILLAGGARAVRGQSALDGFDPNANGSILAVAVQADGKILIGGDFTTLSPNGGAPVFRDHIARLNVDGTLDTTFNARANAAVRAIVVQRDGKILIGGDFTVLSELPRILRGHIARLDAATGLPDSFDPNANDIVRSIALQRDGSVLAGGDFTTIGGQTRSHIARLIATTGLADSFNPNANNTVFALAVQPDRKVLAGGSFTVIGGQSRSAMARLDGSTGLADSFRPTANNFVLTIALQADGRILAGGVFTVIGGRPRNHIARLEPTIGAADSFDPNANSNVLAIALQAEGKILVGGFFNGANSIGGQTRNRIARLDPTGLADSFDPNANGPIFALAVQEDGKILAGGSFSTLAPNGGAAVTRNFIARLEIDGRLDQTLTFNGTSGGSSVEALAVQTDNKILFGGFFTLIDGAQRNHIARLNTDGMLDTAFNPNANGVVHAIAVQADGKVLAGGAFFSVNGGSSIGGQPRNNIARLDPITGLADSFNPNANDAVFAIAVQADGKILVGGAFTHIGGQNRNNIARLNPDGTADITFNPNASLPVNSIAVQADGRILVSGDFNSIGGAARNHIARLDPFGSAEHAFNPNADFGVDTVTVQADGKVLVGGEFLNIGGAPHKFMARLDGTTGAPDTLFNPNPNDEVVSIVVQADGKILVSGFFNGANSIGGAARNHIARLNPNGSADSFDPNANSLVDALALQADGKVLAGGSFTMIGGQNRFLLARLTNDTAALQTLIVTPTTLTLTRGGSSPQFARVTFEFSTDNVNFTPLGNATPAGSNWVLTGLNLPTGQNFIIRARGFYGSGNDNGSGSVLGTRRNTFFSPPGNFVIGDRNAVVGQHVVFWGAQWAKSNSLSGGPAPASFKGFANSTSTDPAACGGTWQSAPGNGSAPPGSVAANIDVIVASSITQSGGIISGDIPEMVVVQIDPGYDGNPGHAGTGTVVSVSCGR
jgi:uncharacterized delta-60 repeat protein